MTAPYRLPLDWRQILWLLATLLMSTSSPPSALAADAGVLVFGGTGRLGSEVVHALVADGQSVTVFARPTSDRSRLDGLAVNYLSGDVLVEEDVAAALRSARFRLVVDALARSESEVSFYEVSARHIAKWAKETGVQQIILHGAVGAGESRAVYPEQSWGRMAELLTAKDAGERHLIDSGVTYTIIRNFIIVAHGTSPTGNARLVADQTVKGNITRKDLAAFTVYCVDNDACANMIFHAIDETLPGR
jgi:uncharacterized protein YbjT (DUF2867 family)